MLPLRQNLVSSVYVVMFAVAHASRSRTPLPQFMTSPIEAVNNWAKAVEEHLNSGSRSRSRSPTHRSESAGLPTPRTTSPELAVLYACAEREALSKLSHSVVDVSFDMCDFAYCYINAKQSIVTAIEYRTHTVWCAIIPLPATTSACRRGGDLIQVERDWHTGQSPFERLYH